MLLSRDHHLQSRPPIMGSTMLIVDLFDQVDAIIIILNLLFHRKWDEWISQC